MTSITLRSSCAALALTLVVSTVGTLHSQQPAQRTPQLQAFCDSIATRLESRSLDVRGAIGGLVSCGAETARLVPGFWRTATPDSSELNALIGVTIVVRDKRLMAETRSLALSANKSYAVRGSALAVLASYYNPVLVGHVRRDRTGVLTPSIGRQVHVRQTAGPQPLDSADYLELDRILRQMAAEDTSKDMRELANLVLVISRDMCKYDRFRPLIRSCTQGG